MMLRYLGWDEAADLIIKGMDGAIGAKTVTYDFDRLMDGAKLVEVLGVRGRDHQAHVTGPRFRRVLCVRTPQLQRAQCARSAAHRRC